MRWVARGLLIGLALIATLLTAGIGGSATPPGRIAIERLVPIMSGGTVTISGLTGWLFGSSGIARITLRDAGGPWLTIEGLTFEWAPRALLSGRFEVRRLAAEQVLVARQPVPSGTSSGRFRLPLRVALDDLGINRVTLATRVVGRPAVLRVTGRARLDAWDQGTGALTIQRVDGAGTYQVDGGIDPAGLHATLGMAEPAQGLVSSLAGLPDIGAISARVTLAGPLTAVATQAEVTAGQLRATATGTIDLPRPEADIAVTAQAPAMAPRPDLAWQGIAIQGRLRGTLHAPEVTASATIAGLRVGTMTVARVTTEVAGHGGTITLTGGLAGVRLPGPRPALLDTAPVRVTADLHLDDADRPVSFHITHTLFDATGRVTLAGDRHGEVRITIPKIAPLAAAGGIADLAGQLGMTVRVGQHDNETAIFADATLRATGPPGPLTSVLGPQARLQAQATLRGKAVTLSRVRIDGDGLHAGIEGTLRPGTADLSWTMTLADLTRLRASLTGALDAHGTVRGAPDDLAIAADLRGTVGAAGLVPGEVTAQVALAGWPNAPSGTVQATGMLLGAPLALDVVAKRTGDAAEITVRRAAWKSARVAGQARVRLDTFVPEGQISFGVARLEDLAPLLGRPLRGAVNGTLDGNTQAARLDATAEDLELPGTVHLGRLAVDATVRDPATHPVVDGHLTLDGMQAAGVAGAAELSVRGTPDALAVRVGATLTNLNDAAAKVDAAGMVDAQARTVSLTTAQAVWRQQTLRLLAPARISLAEGVAIDRLRLGLRHAVLEIGGRVAPNLDLTAKLQAFPVGLAGAFDPALAADGTIDGMARLIGTPASPGGSLQVHATGLRMTAGTGHALPAADVSVTAQLQDGSARIDAHASAGASHLTLSGTVGLAGRHALALRAQGAVDLTMTDPLLTPAGRRARGDVTLEAAITGTAVAPDVTGTASLADGSFRDFVQGIDLSAMTASVRVQGGMVRLMALHAMAGGGPIDANGSVDLAAAGLPMVLRVTARKARPLANDTLTATLDADVTLRGDLTGALTAAGHVLVRRADIRIPERLPASVAVLDVRIAGAPPPTPPAPGPRIILALVIDAPQQIFVRGRGVDAELGGEVTLGGTAAQPIPSGSFQLRRGAFSLGGQVLTFSSGAVSFNGGGLTNPSLNLVATTTAGGVTATLTVGGTVRSPKITLSSVPSLPQDEVLATLLYGARTTSLGPLEVAQIAATLASLSGAAPSLSNPLENVRQALGLDRLAVGAGSQLEAGRYVARDVYIGARQSVTGTGTQAVVQVDLAKGLKLEATAGTTTPSTATGAGGSADTASVGIKYQFDY